MEEEIKILNFGFVNAYLVKLDDGYALIDTGLPIHSKKLENKLKIEGCLPDNLKIVILTHGDLDHIGNAKKLQDKYHVKIAIHKEDYDYMEKNIIPNREGKSLKFKIILKLIKIIIKFQKNRPKSSLFHPDIFLNDNDSLKKYGFNAKVIYIPGHTLGSIGILTEEGDFFSGDTLENRKKPDSANIIENETKLKTSLEKIKKLDVKMVYPGHGKPFLMKDLKLL